jgi:hypothetical protein
MILEAVVAMMAAMTVCGTALLWRIINRYWVMNGPSMTTLRYLTTGLFITLTFLMLWDILQAAKVIPPSWDLWRRVIKWSLMSLTVWLTLSTILFPQLKSGPGPPG